MSDETQFKTHDGLTLAKRQWPAEGDQCGQVVIVHGYGEHSGRYEAVARAFNGLGLNVHAYDHRGHGRSEGKPAYIENFKLLVKDLGSFLESIPAHREHCPRFVLGHSMGGLVLARYIQRNTLPANGLIFSSPFLQLPPDVSPMLLGLAKVLSRLTPWLPVHQIDPKTISSDPEEVQAYEADPLIYHGKIVARTGAELNRAVEKTRAELAAITQPLYVLHGADDQLAPVGGGECLHEQAQASDKTLKIYPGGYHELFKDRDRDKVIADLLEWVKERMEPC